MISVASGLYLSISSSSLIRRTVGYWGGEGEESDARTHITKHTICVSVCCHGDMLYIAQSHLRGVLKAGLKWSVRVYS